MRSLVLSPHKDLVFSSSSLLLLVSRVLRPHTRPPLGPSHTQKNQGRGLEQLRLTVVPCSARMSTCSESDQNISFFKDLVGTLVIGTPT